MNEVEVLKSELKKLQEQDRKQTIQILNNYSTRQLIKAELREQIEEETQRYMKSGVK